MRVKCKNKLRIPIVGINRIIFLLLIIVVYSAAFFVLGCTLYFSFLYEIKPHPLPIMGGIFFFIFGSKILHDLIKGRKSYNWIYLGRNGFLISSCMLTEKFLYENIKEVKKYQHNNVTYYLLIIGEQKRPVEISEEVLKYLLNIKPELINFWINKDYNK